MTNLSNRMRYITKYLEDGCLEVDNNLIKTTLRRITLGRKNYLFAGSHDGARRASMMYSLLLTSKRHDINPYEWLKNTLEEIQDYPINKLADLLPENFRS